MRKSLSSNNRSTVFQIWWFYWISIWKVPARWRFVPLDFAKHFICWGWNIGRVKEARDCGTNLFILIFYSKLGNMWHGRMHIFCKGNFGTYSIFESAYHLTFVHFCSWMKYFIFLTLKEKIFCRETNK